MCLCTLPSHMRMCADIIFCVWPVWRFWLWTCFMIVFQIIHNNSFLQAVLLMCVHAQVCTCIACMYVLSVLLAQSCLRCQSSCWFFFVWIRFVCCDCLTICFCVKCCVHQLECKHMKEYTIIISDWTPTPCRPVLSSPSYLPSQRAVWTACPWEVHCFFLPVGRDWTYYFWEQHGDILSLFGPIHAVRDCWACECEDYWALKLVGNCWACWPVMIVKDC